MWAVEVEVFFFAKPFSWVLIATVLILLLSKWILLFFILFLDFDRDFEMFFFGSLFYLSFGGTGKCKLVAEGLFIFTECFLWVRPSSIALIHDTFDFFLCSAILIFKPSSILLVFLLIFFVTLFLLTKESRSYRFPVESRLNRFRLLAFRGYRCSGYWLRADSTRMALGLWSWGRREEWGLWGWLLGMFSLVEWGSSMGISSELLRGYWGSWIF